MRFVSVATTVIAVVLLCLPAGIRAADNLTQWVGIDAGRTQAAKTRTFTLVYKTKKWQVPVREVSTWFKTKSVEDVTSLQLRPNAVYNYLNSYVSPKVNDLGENSRFIRLGGSIHLVKGGYKGKIVDGIRTSLAVRSAFIQGKKSATVAMKEYRPAIFSAEDFGKLSFPDLLAQGETNFTGSPGNRIHNINVATGRFNGLVIMPGEIFSFNQYLGKVDATNGYKPELVIKTNVTTPEYGGGICQVSTTAFRAAMQAGLEIISRRNHSFPVRYYGAPGYDATVYAPSTDFQFRNDTKYPIYITTKVLATKVVFEIWGTKGGRTVKITGPFTTARREDGSITAAIAQYVYEDGKTVREQNFVSHYQSPDKFPEVQNASGE